MKKKMIMFGLLTIVSFILGAAPVMADTTNVTNSALKLSDEQVKLAQLNWNAYMELAKDNSSAVAYMIPITSVNPDSVIGKAAIIHHFSPYNPYLGYSPYYYCTYQY